MHTIVYSLRTLNGLPGLDYSLGLKMTETNTHVQVPLSTGIVILKKFDYLNKDRIYDDGKTFFMIATKKVKADYIFRFLLQYSLSKIDNRIGKLETVKEQYKQILSAA